MLQRFHAARERHEEGFTLIELLVVVLIIAILAAIAVPVFLNQRRKGWIEQVESGLKNAATAEESYLTVSNVYTNNIADLQTEGFRFSANDVTFAAVGATGTMYCIRGTSLRDTTIVGEYSSQDGAPRMTGGGRADANALAPCP